MISLYALTIIFFKRCGARRIRAEKYIYFRHKEDIHPSSSCAKVTRNV